MTGPCDLEIVALSLRAHKCGEGGCDCISNTSLQIVGLAILADYRGHVALLPIDKIIEVAHVLPADFAAQLRQCAAQLRKFFKRGPANDWYCVIWWKVMAVIFQDHQMQRVDDAVGGVAGHNVHFVILQRAINQAEVHHAGLLAESQAVALAPSTKTIRALQKFKPNADAPLRSYRREVRHAPKMKLPRVLTAYDHRKGVFKAQWLGNFKIKSLTVKLLHALVHGGRIAGRTFVKNSIECSARVLNVKVDLARLHGFVHQQSTAKICFALYVNAGARFDVLREQLGENNLFREKFGADYDLRFWCVTRSEER